MLSERTALRLRDIIEDARRVATFVEGMSVDDFIADERTIFAVERLLQRITEAAVQMAPADVSRLGVPVAQMRALGNRLRHEYRDIDRSVIFGIAINELPLLASAAESALEG